MPATRGCRGGKPPKRRMCLMEELEPSLRYELGVPLGVLCDNPWQATALADDEYEWVGRFAKLQLDEQKPRRSSRYVAADSLLREWPGPVRITWVPSAENATVKSVYCERDAKLAVEARQLKESLQVLPLQGRWLKLVTEMNEC